MPAPRKKLAAQRIPVTDLLTLAFLNTRRHGIRAAVNIVGIAIAVSALVFFLSFYRGTYEGIMFSSVIDYATSHGQFMSASFDDDDPDVWLESENLIDEGLAGNGNPATVNVAAPRLMSPAFAGDGSRKAAVTLAGVDFEAEKDLLSIDERMKDGSFGGTGVTIGKKLAETLNLSVGDEIRIQANTANGAPNLDYWKIDGIFSTGYPPLDRGMVFMNLGQAQTFLDADGKINKIYCRVSGEKDSVGRERGILALETGEVTEKLAALSLAFKSWRNYAKPIVEDAKKDSSFYAIFIAILLFLSLSTMAGTMRVAVFERKREIGMLRASGWMRVEITELFLFEALVIGIAGSLAGCLLGGIFSLALQVNPIEFGNAMSGLDIPSFALTCDLQPDDFLISLAAGLATATLAGIMPAVSGARMPILSALAER